MATKAQLLYSDDVPPAPRAEYVNKDPIASFSASPPNNFGGNAYGHGVFWNIAGYNCTGPND